MAVDWVHNYSEFSETIELKKPDIIPPTTPIFSDYKVSEDGIRMEWVASSSKDVVRHELFRKLDTGDWQLIATVDTTGQHNYLDEMVEPDSIYSYTIEAVDDDSNRSKQASPLQLKMIDFSKKPAIETLTVSPDEENKLVNLEWDYPYEGNYRFILYRAKNESPFVSYESLDGDENSFTDRNVQAGQSYKYTFRVIYEDGKKSGFSGTKTVQLNTE